MLVVGLTGGIATGKSTVGRLLAEGGVPVVDADQVAAQILTAPSATLDVLVEKLGPSILLDSGDLNRPVLRRMLIADSATRAIVDGVTHPAIRKQIAAELMNLASSGEAAAVVEAALMVETGSHKLYPVLIVVRCSAATQLRRVMARDSVSEAEAAGIIATQMSMEEKVAVATHVVTNDGSVEDLRSAVDAVWRKILKER